MPKLKLKWAFAFPGDLQSYAQSTIAGGRVFVGSWGGKVYSLNAATGCIHWFFDAGQGVRSAISVGRVGNRDIAVFGDAQANVYALDAATGSLLWKTDVDDFPVGRISGSPTLHNGRIYVGTASGEEASGANPAYECCKFRGSVVAVNAADGKILWKTYTVEEPKPTEEERRRHAALGTIGRAGVVFAGDRREAQSSLRHDRQQLQRPDVADERCLYGARHGLRQDPVVEADDAERRLHRGLPSA